MNDQTNQPIPGTQAVPAKNTDPQGQENRTEEKIPKTVLEKLKAMMAKSKKVKLIVILFGFTVFLFILFITMSLSRRPPKETVPEAMPTPAPESVTPTQAPEVQEQDVNDLIKDIDDYNPDQNELQPPVVDLEIRL